MLIEVTPQSTPIPVPMPTVPAPSVDLYFSAVFFLVGLAIAIFALWQNQHFFVSAQKAHLDEMRQDMTELKSLLTSIPAIIDGLKPLLDNYVAMKVELAKMHSTLSKQRQELEMHLLNMAVERSSSTSNTKPLRQGTRSNLKKNTGNLLSPRPTETVSDSVTSNNIMVNERSDTSLLQTDEEIGE